MHFAHLFVTLQAMNENVIIADANFVDRVAFDLTVNFERMLERRIPKADIARWTECIALDGGLRAGEHQKMLFFRPGEKDGSALKVDDMRMNGSCAGGTGAFLDEVASILKLQPEELNGMAFKGNLGEFCFSTPNGEDYVDKDELFLDTLSTVLQQEGVKRVMVIPDESILNKVREVIRKMDNNEKFITLFAMSPQTGRNFQQEILGYSLMAALGIKGEEIEGKSEK